MPRTISNEFKAHLAGSVSTIAYCIKLTRADGVVQGFTSDNTSFQFGGVIYEASAAGDPSSIRATEGVGIDNLDFVGLIDSSRVTEVDISAGRYDNALVELFVINPNDFSMGIITLITGYIGDIDFQDGTYTAEIRSLFQRLSQQIGELTSALCRVKRLGDSRCKVDLAPFTFTRTLDTITSPTLMLFAGDSNTAGYFTNGTLEMRSGPNKGFTTDIKEHTVTVSGKATIKLQLPFPFALTVGQVGVLVAGCDRKHTTCKAKFSNLANFRGEPFIPGTRQLLDRGNRSS